MILNIQSEIVTCFCVISWLDVFFVSLTLKIFCYHFRIKGNFQKIDSPTPELSIINGLDHDYQVKHLNRIFEENADLWSCRNKSAVIFNSEFDDECIFTYKQLNQAANRMAALLIDHIQTHKLKRNGDGDWIVAVCMPPSHELIVTLLAIWKAGAAYLPIDVTFPKNRIDHILQDAQPTLIIYDSDLVDSNLFNSPVEVLSFAKCKALSANYNDANISNGKMLQRASGSRIALILYTSGSSGVPKGMANYFITAETHIHEIISLLAKQNLILCANEKY